MKSHTIRLNAMVELEGQTVEMEVELSGTMDRDRRIHDLVFTSNTPIEGLFDADEFTEAFQQDIDATLTDRAYEEHREREMML